MPDHLTVYADMHGLFIKPINGNINIYRPQRSKYTNPTLTQFARGFTTQLRAGQHVRVRYMSSGSGTIELQLLNSSTVEIWCSHGPVEMDGKVLDPVTVWKPYEEPTDGGSNTQERSKVSQGG